MTHLALNRTLMMAAVALAASLSGCSLLQQNDEPTLGSAQAGSYDASPAQKDRFHKKAYAAVGLGYSWLEPDTSEINGTDVNDRGNAGGQITIGTDLNKRLSLELHSADLGSAGLSPGGRINYHLHGGSALVYAGKNRHNNGRRGLTGFGRIGAGMLENSPVGQVNYDRENSTHVLFGAGVEYATRMGLGVRAEVISYEEDVQYGQVGMIYRIGKKRARKAVQIVQAPAPATEPAPVVAAAVAQPAPYNPCDEFDGVLEGVNFHSASAELTDSASQILDGVANKLVQCDRPVQIAAHTDSQGSTEYNQNLSNQRAKSVLRFLHQRGIETSRMNARAFGESQPIDSNETADGRSRNRRVELISR